MKKKLDSLNISCVSTVESCSSFYEKNESSSVSSSTNQNQMELKIFGSDDEIISVDSNEKGLTKRWHVGWFKRVKKGVLGRVL